MTTTSNKTTAFSAAFPHLADTPILGDYACTYSGRPGRLYITSQALCFLSGLIGEQRVELSVDDIVGVEKKAMGFGLVSNALEIAMADEKTLFFGAFFHRDDVYGLIQHILFPESSHERFGSTTTTAISVSDRGSSSGVGSRADGDLAVGSSFKKAPLRQGGTSGSVGESLSDAFSSTVSFVGGVLSRARRSVAPPEVDDAVPVHPSDVPQSDYDEEYNAIAVMILAGELASRNHSSLFLQLREKHMEYLEISRDRVKNAMQRLELAQQRGNGQPSSVGTARVGSVVFQNPALVRRCVGCGGSFGVFSTKRHCPLCGRIFCSDCLKNRVPLPSGDPLKGVCYQCCDLLSAPERNRDWARTRREAVATVPYTGIVGGFAETGEAIRTLLPSYSEETRFGTGGGSSVGELRARLQGHFTALEDLIRRCNQLLASDDGRLCKSDVRLLQGLRMIMLALMEEAMPVFREAARTENGWEVV